MRKLREWFRAKDAQLSFVRTADRLIVGATHAASGLAVLDRATGEVRHQLKTPFVRSVTVAGARVVASVGAEEIWAWDDPDCRGEPHRATIDTATRHFAPAPDGTLTWVDSAGAFWVGGRLANQVRSPGTSAAAVGDRVVSGHDDGKLRVWSLAEPGKRPRAVASGGRRVRVAWAHGRLFTRTEAGEVARWDADVTAPEVRWAAPTAPFGWTAIPGPAGRVATWARGAAVQVWTDEGAPLGEWAPPGPVHQLAFEGDGLWVAAEGRLVQLGAP